MVDVRVFGWGDGGDDGSGAGLERETLGGRICKGEVLIGRIGRVGRAGGGWKWEGVREAF